MTYETTDPVAPDSASTTSSPAPMMRRPSSASYVPPGDGSGCAYLIEYWDVEPAYSGPAFETVEEAAAADPVPPPPPPPALPTWRNLYDWPNGHGYVGFHSATSSSALYSLATNLGGNPGVWIWPAGGDYPDGGYAEWTYTAPGTTRISTVTLSFAYRNKLLAHHCIVVGLRTATTVVTQTEWCKPAKPPDSQRDVQLTLADPSANPTSKTLFFRVRMDCKNNPGCTKHIPSLDPLQSAGTARLKFVDMTLVDDDLPVVTASGELWELGENYSNGREVYGVTIDATDAGAGIVRNWLDHHSLGTLASANAPCDYAHHTPALDNRVCPQAFGFSSTVDSNPFPEGTNRLVAKSIDPASNVGIDPWQIYVDRTPPSVPGGLRLSGFDGLLGLATVEWNASSDPPLPDGVPGSGVETQEVRHSVNGGAFGAWESGDDRALTVGDLNPGDTIQVEVRAVDKVANVSASGSASFTMPATSTSSGPVLTGRVVDGSGGGVQADVAIYLNSESDAETVGTATTSADGSFTVRLTRARAAAVAREAVANNGWVNFDVLASNGTLTYDGVVARRIGVGGWTDGTSQPAPFQIVLAPGADAVIGGGSLRTTQGVEQFVFCTIQKIKVDEMRKFVVIGELHTGSDQTAWFEYGRRGDSHVQVAASANGTVWKAIKASVHVSNTVGSGNLSYVRWNERSNFGRQLKVRMLFHKIERFLSCNPQVRSWRWEAKKWEPSQQYGNDLRHLDDHCLDTLAQFRSPFAPGGEYHKNESRAHEWDVGAEIAGVGVNARSGWSQWVDSHWRFGRRFDTYWLCGNNNANLDEATRIFAGA